MSLNDPLANTLSKIVSLDKQGKKEAVIFPVSKSIKNVLTLLKDNNYIGEFNETADAKGGFLSVNLLGKINGGGVIKPRFNVKNNDYEKFEKRFLPAFGFGFLVVSTNQGMMTQEEAIKRKLGGKLIAFIY
ncbi:MAG: 30S ribosomal protein S8 [Nanoarchaeota archaeon]|nr:30S ribosomal protein S8 [Nanoarchaeota archaeon]